jgi:hypothetical protein
MAETLRSYDGGEGFRLVVELRYPISKTKARAVYSRKVGEFRIQDSESVR